MTDETHDSIRLEDLAAHAEGRLPAGSALRARVEEHLRRHPEDAARVEAYRRQDELLHEAFDDVARQPLPARLQERLRQPPQPWPRPRLALAASLVVGIAIGWLVAQIEYGPEGGDGGGSLAEQTAESLTGTGTQVDPAVTKVKDGGAMLLPDGAPDLSGIGLSATGNVALEDPAAGLRRYEYRDGAGNMLQLLVTRDARIDPASVYTLQNGEFTLAYWHQGDRTYLLSGAIEPDRLQALAHETMATLESGQPAASPAVDETSDTGVVAGNRNEVGNGEGAGATVEDPVEPMPVIDQM